MGVKIPKRQFTLLKSNNFGYSSDYAAFLSQLFVYKMIASKPLTIHYAPFYAGYVGQIPDGADLLALLRSQQVTVAELLAGITEETASSAYAPGKWTIKQVVGHMADTERIFAYRALRLYRGDASPLPGFDQDLYADNGHFDQRSLVSLAQEFFAVRTATLLLLETFGQTAQLDFVGQASGGPITARALAYLIAGHERHHLNILYERYAV